jgi:competence ComEA-like helix-hairpin-helix protein
MKIFDINRYRHRRIVAEWKRKISKRGLLVTVASVIAILSAAVWLLRDVKDVAETFRPGEGSLIVNINTASERELISVPGIGATRAAQIVAFRPYESVDDLERIAGISGKTLESLRPFVTVEGDTRKRD